MKTKIKKIIRALQTGFQKITNPSLSKAYGIAKKTQYFNATWYREHYGNFPSDFHAFRDYMEKSSFANVNPSALFDTETYNRSNIDIYHSGNSPLIHYLYHGRYEGRVSSEVINRWTPADSLIPQDTPTWKSQKVALVLHIFYPDFVEKFAHCIKHFPISVDVFVTCATDQIAQDAKQKFSATGKVNQIKTAVCENRGRNFGPFLVHFSKELLNYDLMCHLHSKKSLYSGREQTQWFDYQNQFLLKDGHVVKSVLRLFDEHSNLGIYYPTSFWMMPAWVNHWTCNKPFAQEFTAKWGVDFNDNFVNYPVGGMFWARPKALAQLLDVDYEYTDFPAEPLPNDGSKLHALERLLGLLVEREGYEQFFYYPPLGRFTRDKSYISTSYYKPPHALKNDLMSFDIVSFDVFDTVLRRRFTEPDYAKFLLGKELCENGHFESPEAFVAKRNDCELKCRQERNFEGDVCIKEVYERLSKELNIERSTSTEWMDKEFLYDLEMAEPKDEIVEIIKQLSLSGKEIWFVTDIYYTQSQIELMLRKIGVAIPYRLFVSSSLRKRKDSGTMWTYIKQLVAEKGSSFVHVGDNVRSDAQICGDFGLQNIHILNPMDKWAIAGLDDIASFEKPTEQDILKWGPQISHFGRYPYFGE
ncbi:rhamnan synthesis F family protein [Alteromonas confluentis]|uniref:Glycosyl transferase family 1 n=1 Tax=Alteromonas confluentis TaxID=1656094 RepID=A0A1E7Z9M8_9ALTE|nr:rhamnan synthesis F family protein [Alteromonas confluentis]OFC70114.1 glycosyl transferase family 1 [Alteromonas confluentis]